MVKDGYLQNPPRSTENSRNSNIFFARFSRPRRVVVCENDRNSPVFHGFRKRLPRVDRCLVHEARSQFVHIDNLVRRIQGDDYKMFLLLKFQERQPAKEVFRGADGNDLVA